MIEIYCDGHVTKFTYTYGFVVYENGTVIERRCFRSDGTIAGSTYAEACALASAYIYATLLNEPYKIHCDSKSLVNYINKLNKCKSVSEELKTLFESERSSKTVKHILYDNSDKNLADKYIRTCATPIKIIYSNLVKELTRYLKQIVLLKTIGMQEQSIFSSKGVVLPSLKSVDITKIAERTSLKLATTAKIQADSLFESGIPTIGLLSTNESQDLKRNLQLNTQPKESIKLLEPLIPSESKLSETLISNKLPIPAMNISNEEQVMSHKSATIRYLTDLLGCFYTEKQNSTDISNELHYKILSIESVLSILNGS